MTTPDRAPTGPGQGSQAREAAALAGAARALGVRADELAQRAGRRLEVWKAAQLPTSPAASIWEAAAALLAGEEVPALPVHPCVFHQDRPARLYLSGWRCDECSPWARAGRPCPCPPAGQPLAKTPAPTQPAPSGHDRPGVSSPTAG